MKDVESEVDALQNAHTEGTQTKEDSEHPEAVDVSRGIDETEQRIKES